MKIKGQNRAGVCFFVLCLLLCGIVWGGDRFLGDDSVERRLPAYSVGNESIRKETFPSTRSFPSGKRVHTNFLSLQENYTSDCDGVLSLEGMRQVNMSPVVPQADGVQSSKADNHAIYATSGAKVASYAGGVAAQPQTVSYTAVQPNGGGHTFLALAAPVRRSSVAFETGELAIGAETVHGGKRYGPGGSGIGDGKGDKDQSAVEGPTPLPDAIGFVLLLAGAYALCKHSARSVQPTK